MHSGHPRDRVSSATQPAVELGWPYLQAYQEDTAVCRALAWAMHSAQ